MGESPLRTSLFDPSVRISTHSALETLSFRFCLYVPYGYIDDNFGVLQQDCCTSSCRDFRRRGVGVPFPHLRNLIHSRRIDGFAF